MQNYELLSVFALQAKLPPLLVRRIKVSELSWSVRSLHKYKYKYKYKTDIYRNTNTYSTNTRQAHVEIQILTVQIQPVFVELLLHQYSFRCKVAKAGIQFQHGKFNGFAFSSAINDH